MAKSKQQKIYDANKQADRKRVADRRLNAYPSDISDAPHSQSTVSSRRNAAINTVKKTLKRRASSKKKKR